MPGPAGRLEVRFASRTTDLLVEFFYRFGQECFEFFGGFEHWEVADALHDLQLERGRMLPGGGDVGGRPEQGGSNFDLRWLIGEWIITGGPMMPILRWLVKPLRSML